MARPDWMTYREVVDADRPVTLNIRQHDIDEGKALDPENCIAARCILRALDASYVWVYRSKAYVVWDDGQPIQRYQNSKALESKVIKVLDDPNRPNTDIKPGLYDLLPPTAAQALGRDRTARKPNTRSKRKDRGHRVIGRLVAAKAS